MLRSGTIVCLCVVTFLATGALAQESFVERFADEHAPAVIAHRSAKIGGHPENTLAWIEHAINRGIDVIHINPQRTADDHYILMHDHTLNRMTDVEQVFPDGPPDGPSRAQRGGRDFVGDYSLRQIQELRVKGGEDGGSHPVPGLEESLDFIDGRILVLLGLKSYEVESLAAVLNGQHKENLMLFELYYPGTDQSKLRDLSNATGVGVAVAPFRSNDYLEELEGIFEQLGPALRSYWVDSAGLTPDLRARMSELNLLAVYSGWDGPEDYALLEKSDPNPWQAVLDQGFSVVTDQPELLLEVLGR